MFSFWRLEMKHCKNKLLSLINCIIVLCILLITINQLLHYSKCTLSYCYCLYYIVSTYQRNGGVLDGVVLAEQGGINLSCDTCDGVRVSCWACNSFLIQQELFSTNSNCAVESRERSSLLEGFLSSGGISENFCWMK